MQKGTKNMQTEMNLFAYATRKKMRFSYKGSIGVEELWDLSPKELDSIYKNLKREMKSIDNEDSLLSENKAITEVNDLAVGAEIIKSIVETKLFEAELEKQKRENKEKKQKIMEIISMKKEQKMLDSSVEELEKMLAEL